MGPAALIGGWRQPAQSRVLTTWLKDPHKDKLLGPKLVSEVHKNIPDMLLLGKSLGWTLL